MQDKLFTLPSSNKRIAPIVGELEVAFPEEFSSLHQAYRFCSSIWIPKSFRWTYQLNAKSGNTFTLLLLFELEFGVPFSVRLRDMHPGSAIFHTVSAGVFQTLSSSEFDKADFLSETGLRIATVRDPLDRALSSFLYLCLDQNESNNRFVRDRIRMSALVRFDWEKHPNTAEGFVRFLEYIDLVRSDYGIDEIDAHWLPQSIHIRPKVYKPGLVGRVEEMQVFCQELCDRLGKHIPDDVLSRLYRNKSKTLAVSEAHAIRDQKDAKSLVYRIYEDDYENFSY